MTDTPDGARVRPFADFLREQARGTSHDELSEGLRDLVQRVRDTGKAGTITYVVRVETMKGTTSQLMVSDEIKLKLPEHDRQASIFFADRENNLTRNDPEQPVFETLRELPGGGTLNVQTGEVREAK